MCFGMCAQPPSLYECQVLSGHLNKLQNCFYRIDLISYGHYYYYYDLFSEFLFVEDGSSIEGPRFPLDKAGRGRGGKQKV